MNWSDVAGLVVFGVLLFGVGFIAGCATCATLSRTERADSGPQRWNGDGSPEWPSVRVSSVALPPKFEGLINVVTHADLMTELDRIRDQEASKLEPN